MVNILDKKKNTVSEALTDLAEKDLLEKTRSGKTNILELSRRGWRAWKEAVGRPEPNGAQDSISLHNFSVRFEIRNKSDLEDGWRERWVQGKTRRYNWDPTNDSYVYWRDNWKIRVTGEHVIIRLEDELRGHDPVNLKDRAMLEIFDAKNWFEKHAPARVSSDPSDFRIWVQRQHLAIVEDPFCSFVDQYSEVDISDVKFYDESGTERLWLDDSDGENHLEGGNAPGQNRTHAEDDIEHIKNNLYEWMLDNKDAWGKIQEFGEALADENNELSIEALQDASSGAQNDTFDTEYTISSTWIHRYGHVMGWAEEIQKPVCLVRAEELTGGENYV